VENPFDRRGAAVTGSVLHAEALEIVQVNVGRRCNQACTHCHMEASPQRSEVMAWPVMERVAAVAVEVAPVRVDLTGGAPELHPHLPELIRVLRSREIPVQVRTNLTALLEEGEALARFLRDQQVRLVASLPCYLEENVRAQRGPEAYAKSIRAITLLNELGYGRDPALGLDLVYNPAGPFLPPDQARLEADYRRELSSRFGIVFTRLLTITNMPVGRFWASLRRAGEQERYLSLLREAFNPRTLAGLMCRRQVSVGWDGRIYDCDFNLALGLPVDHGAAAALESFDAAALARRRIVTGEHCFGCTAGAGSSCGGALS